MGVRDFFIAVKDGLMAVSKFITSVVNFILLIPLFFIGVVLTSLLSKVFGKRYLALTLRKRKSYWVKKNLSTQKLEKYYRMF